MMQRLSCPPLEPLSPGVGAEPAWAGLVLAAVAMSGCGAAPAEAPATASRPAALTATQGMSLQGMSLQGMSLQGMSLQGMSLQGMSLQGMSLQGTKLQGVSLQGKTLQGMSLQGTQLLGTDGNGAAVSLRIAAVQTDAQDPSGEITLYALEAKNAATGLWQNVCDPDNSGQRWAIPVSGAWTATGAHVVDATRVTFACTSGVIAKCVRWGYKPWKSVNGASLEPYHQACTRMARADYCGDGQSFTQNGTQIDLYDPLGIQTETPNSGMFVEAGWTPAGAACIGKARWLGLTSSGGLAIPQCLLDPAKISLVLDGSGCYVRFNNRSMSDIRTWNKSGINVTEALQSQLAQLFSF